MVIRSFTRLRNVILTLFTVVAYLAGSYSAEASHTRGSTLYWEKHPTLNNTIILYMTTSVAGLQIIGSYTALGDGGALSFGTSVNLTYSANGSSNVTESNISSTYALRARTIFNNTIENYHQEEIGRMVNGVWTPGVIITYNNTSWPYSLTFNNVCCRVSNISAGTGTESNLATKVNLTAGNSSAASSSPAVIQVPLSSVGGTWTYQLSATDPDQDLIQYRIGTNAEFGGNWSGSVSGPTGLTISQSGLITWNVPNGLSAGTLAVLGYVIEDRDPFNNNLKSASSYDIILRIVNTTTNQAPVVVSQPNTTQYFPYQQSLSVPYNFTIVVEDVYNGTSNTVPNPSASAPAGYLNWPYPQISQIGSIPNLSFTVNYLPNSQRAEINGTFTPSLAQAGGTYSAQFQVNDGSLIVYPSVFIQVRNNPNPSVTTFTKVGDICQGVSFAAADFTSNYTDPDQDPLQWIRITNVPSGMLLFKGQAVTNATEILLSEIGQLTYTNATPGTYSFSWEGRDNQGFWSTSAVPVQMTIAGIATSAGSVVNNVTSSSFAVDPNLVVVSATNISSASVSISSGFVAGDLLSVPTHVGGSASYDYQLGVLTFTGNYTSSELQNALRLVEFQSQGTSQQRTFAFSAGAQIVGACNAFLGYKSLNNTLPTISSIANQTTCIGGTTPQASITVADTETGVNDLIVSVVSSSNLSVVPVTNITLAVTGASRSVTVSNSGVFGSSLITLAVTDQGGGQTTTSFVWSNTSTDGIVASAGSTFNPYAGTPVVVDPYITVTSQSNVSGALVSISNFQTGDVLAMQSGYTLPSGLTAQFNTSTGILTLTGSITAANMQAALRKVVFSTTSNSELARSITFSLGSALPNPANGHFYEYVSGAITWANALSAAESLTFNGLQGYLATVLSSDENEFIRTKLSNDGWIGGTDDFAVLNSRITSANYADQSAAEGQWHWVSGPASDRIQFWNGLINGQTVNSAFVNWNTNQPDNAQSSEHYMQMYFLNNGSWYDLPGGSYSLPGYIVEYGGIGTSQSCFAISATKVLELNQTPTLTIASAQSSCIGTASITRNFTVADANDGTGALQLSLISSSNTGLVPLGNVSFSGSGANRVVTIVPVANVTGTSNLVLQIIDRYGKSSQQTLPITVTANDTVRPVWSNVPANMTVPTSPTACNVVVTWTAPTVTDNCPAQPTVTVSKASGTTFALGTTTVTYTAVDAAGNSRQASFTVTVVDQTAPVIATPVNITKSVDANSCASSTVVVAAPVVTDQCNQLVATGVRSDNLALTAAYPLGVTIITWTSSDLAGNVAVAKTQTLTIVDTIAPKVTTQLDSLVYVDENSCVYNWQDWRSDLVITDNCGETAVLTSALPQNLFLNKGVHIINYTLSDSHGNARVYNQRVRVVDTISPKLTNMPANITAYAGANCQTIITWVDPTPSDNCVNFVMTSSHNSGGVFPKGVSQVNFLVTDASGRTKSGGFTITVLDTLKPVIPVQAATITLNASGQASLTLTQVLTSAGITDNCGVVSSSLSKSAFTCADLGANTVTLSATDASGNVGSATAVVTVLDSIKPVLTVASDTIVSYVSGNQCSKVVNVTGVSATDNCAANITYSPVNGSVFSVGTTPVVVTASDASGNSRTKTMYVVVRDSINPVITGVPVNATIAPVVGSCSATVTWASPAAFDNCSAVLTSSAQSGSVFAVGTHTVTWTATDASGNVRTAALTFTVTDVQAPQLVSVPTTITRYATPWQCNAIAYWPAITATDNCSTAATVTTSVASGSVFALGTTTVIATALDAAGNTTTASFNVVVLDSIKPLWTSVPQQVVSGFCAATISFVTPTATDNCMGVSVVQTAGLPSGSVFPIGVTTNTFVATDASGNARTTSFTVTVQGSTFTYTPTQTTYCNVNMVVDLMPVGASNLTFSGAGVSGTSSFNPLNAGLGNHVITYTYVDALGCQTIGTFVITVNAVPPIPVILRITSTTLKVDDTYATYQWRRNGVNIAGATQQFYTVTSSGIYTVVVGNGNCTSVSNPYGFGFTIGEEELELNDLRVQPNPNNGQFTLIHSLPLDQVQSVQIVDMLGRVVYSAPFNDVRKTFDLSGVAQGQYLVVVRSTTHVVTKSIVIQH